MVCKCTFAVQMIGWSVAKWERGVKGWERGEGANAATLPLFAEISRAYQYFARQKSKRNRGGEGVRG
jgi:hypothetical protein